MFTLIAAGFTAFYKFTEKISYLKVIGVQDEKEKPLL
jgi:hypothetical protein